ncbi:very-long-chain 3-oxoacyl-CoA reductase-like isoform X2 [Eriocheir sinensis]|uniref:very-long-chain 3-oxoacyl-CoA reductase-like isoform X2 n=1 Tax=Eriocheir sinensis TaxID=95602 RepID=UPI0021C87E2E|nr:very-long-chain 3-oxoacyl-CoA reductase-like isoform X2 [Eriocheir sinensis]
MFEGNGCCVLWVCTVVGVLYVTKWTLSLLLGLFTYLRMAVGSRLWKRNLVAEYGGKWAVITGSTDGIGKEYARQLAQKGMNIVLISRTLEKLKKVEEEIKKEFGVETHIIAADFSNGRPIYEGIANGLKGKDIGILVNNVGYLGPKLFKFNDMTEEEIWRYVNVNVVSVVAMTKIVLPQMLARKRGAIINISSFIAMCPIPFSAVYSATKIFVTYFSRAVEFEYRDSGITVQAIQPGAVPTNLTSFSKLFRKPGGESAVDSDKGGHISVPWRG